MRIVDSFLKTYEKICFIKKFPVMITILVNLYFVINMMGQVFNILIAL